MQFKKGIFVGGIVLLSASGAMAETVTQAIARQLGDQGYTRITISRTLLGRSRIIATGPNKNREIVVNPRTGEILRDFRSPVAGMPTISDDDDVGFEIGSGASDTGGSDSDDDNDDNGGTDGSDGGSEGNGGSDDSNDDGDDGGDDDGDSGGDDNDGEGDDGDDGDGEDGDGEDGDDGDSDGGDDGEGDD